MPPLAVLGLVAAALSGPPPWHVMQCGNELRQRPARCTVFDMASETFGLDVQLVSLRWKKWGQRAATATGREGRQAVVVRVWRPRRDCEGLGYAYTRIRIRSARGVVTAPLSGCPVRLLTFAKVPPIQSAHALHWLPRDH